MVLLGQNPENSLQIKSFLLKQKRKNMYLEAKDNLLINTIDKNHNLVTDFKFETKVLLTFSDPNERAKILDDNAFIYKVHTYYFLAIIFEEISSKYVLQQ